MQSADQRLRALLGQETNPLYTQTPLAVTRGVRHACATVSPGTAPFFVNVAPLPWAEPLQCFQNVHRQIQQQGGQAVNGYLIAEFPRVLAELQLHALWIDDAGRPIDITPRNPADYIPRETERLFLPLPSSHEPDRPATNRQFVLSHARSVREFVDARNRLAQLHAQRRFEQAHHTAQQLLALFHKLDWYPEPYDPCPCGSRKAFNACHGK